RTAINRLAAGRVIAVTGSEATWIALMVAIYASTHSTVWMSAALFVTIAGQGVATPLLGGLGGHMDRRKLVIAAEVSGARVCRAPLALVVLALFASVAQSPFIAASTAAVPNLVGPDQLSWANSQLAIGRNAGALLGPLVGGVLSGLIDPYVVFGVNAVCFAF